VVGGGVAGLAAALRLRECLPRAHIILYDGARRLGGKLRTGELAGAPVETGAEAFLMRDPAGGGESAALALARRVGLGDALAHPEPVPPAIAVDGRLRPVPKGTLVGVPSDLSRLDGVAEADANADRDEGRPLLRPGEDVAVGELVRKRLGDQVVDRLVDPMLGGVYAGRADDLSLAATMPGLARACREHPTLLRAVRAAIRPGPATGPVFATVRGGLGRLVDAVVAALGPVELRLGLPVRELTRTPDGWRLVAGPVPRPEVATVDAVVLAVPARPAARLLGEVSPAAAAEVGALDYASVGLVTLALPPTDLPALSGFLVPTTEGRAVKAATFFTNKWAHLRRPDGTVVLRASLGRYGEPEVLRRDDADLVALVREELGVLLGRPLPAPVDALVTRWGGALPQYAPGHLDRVARSRAALPATLALAGAAYDGVGIPACVRSGETAAEKIIFALEGSMT